MLFCLALRLTNDEYEPLLLFPENRPDRIRGRDDGRFATTAKGDDKEVACTFISSEVKHLVVKVRCRIFDVVGEVEMEEVPMAFFSDRHSHFPVLDHCFH